MPDADVEHLGDASSTLSDKSDEDDETPRLPVHVQDHLVLDISTPTTDDNCVLDRDPLTPQQQTGQDEMKGTAHGSAVSGKQDQKDKQGQQSDFRGPMAAGGVQENNPTVPSDPLGSHPVFYEDRRDQTSLSRRCSPAGEILPSKLRDNSYGNNHETTQPDNHNLQLQYQQGGPAAAYPTPTLGNMDLRSGPGGQRSNNQRHEWELLPLQNPGHADGNAGQPGYSPAYSAPQTYLSSHMNGQASIGQASTGHNSTGHTRSQPVCINHQGRGYSGRGQQAVSGNMLSGPYPQQSWQSAPGGHNNPASDNGSLRYANGRHIALRSPGRLAPHNHATDDRQQNTFDAMPNNEPQHYYVQLGVSPGLAIDPILLSRAHTLPAQPAQQGPSRPSSSRGGIRGRRTSQGRGYRGRRIGRPRHHTIFEFADEDEEDSPKSDSDTSTIRHHDDHRDNTSGNNKDYRKGGGGAGSSSGTGTGRGSGSGSGGGTGNNTGNGNGGEGDSDSINDSGSGNGARGQLDKGDNTDKDQGESSGQNEGSIFYQMLRKCGVPRPRPIPLTPPTANDPFVGACQVSDGSIDCLESMRNPKWLRWTSQSLLPLDSEPKLMLSGRDILQAISPTRHVEVNRHIRLTKLNKEPSQLIDLNQIINKGFEEAKQTKRARRRRRADVAEYYHRLEVLAEQHAAEMAKPALEASEPQGEDAIFVMDEFINWEVHAPKYTPGEPPKEE